MIARGLKGESVVEKAKVRESFPFSACIMTSFPKQNVDDCDQYGICCISVSIVRCYYQRSHRKCVGILKVKVVYRTGSFGTCFKVTTKYRSSS